MDNGGQKLNYATYLQFSTSVEVQHKHRSSAQEIFPQIFQQFSTSIMPHEYRIAIVLLLILAFAPQSRCTNRISCFWLVSSLTSSEACDFSSPQPFGQGGRFVLLPCRLDAERMDCSQTATLRCKGKGAERHVQGRRKSRQRPPNRNFEVSKVCKCCVSVSEVCRRQSKLH